MHHNEAMTPRGTCITLPVSTALPMGLLFTLPVGVVITLRVVTALPFITLPVVMSRS